MQQRHIKRNFFWAANIDKCIVPFFKSSLMPLAFNIWLFNISGCLLIFVTFDIKWDFLFLETSSKIISAVTDIWKFWKLITGTSQQISHYTGRRQNSVVGKTSVRRMTLDIEITKVLTNFYFYALFLEHLVAISGVDGNYGVLDDCITFGLMVFLFEGQSVALLVIFWKIQLLSFLLLIQ